MKCFDIPGICSAEFAPIDPSFCLLRSPTDGSHGGPSPAPGVGRNDVSAGVPAPRRTLPGGDQHPREGERDCELRSTVYRALLLIDKLHGKLFYELCWYCR